MPKLPESSHAQVANEGFVGIDLPGGYFYAAISLWEMRFAFFPLVDRREAWSGASGYDQL